MAAVFGKLLQLVTRGFTALGVFAILLMMVHISVEIVMRWVFNQPLPGTISIVSNYYMVVACFVPLVLLEQYDRHISVDVLANLMPGVMQIGMSWISGLLTIVVMSALTVRSWEDAVSKFKIGASITQGDASIVVWPAYFLLPVGCGLMVLVALVKLINGWFGAAIELPQDGLDNVEEQVEEGI